MKKVLNKVIEALALLFTGPADGSYLLYDLERCPHCGKSKYHGMGGGGPG